MINQDSSNVTPAIEEPAIEEPAIERRVTRGNRNSVPSVPSVPSTSKGPQKALKPEPVKQSSSHDSTVNESTEEDVESPVKKIKSAEKEWKFNFDGKTTFQKLHCDSSILVETLEVDFEKEKGKFVCPFCYKSYPNVSKLNRHVFGNEAGSQATTNDGDMNENRSVEKEGTDDEADSYDEETEVLQPRVEKGRRKDVRKGCASKTMTSEVWRIIQVFFRSKSNILYTRVQWAPSWIPKSCINEYELVWTYYNDYEEAPLSQPNLTTNDYADEEDLVLFPDEYTEEEESKMDTKKVHEVMLERIKCLKDRKMYNYATTMLSQTDSAPGLDKKIR